MAPPQLVAAAAVAASVLALKLLGGRQQDRKASHGSTSKSTVGTLHAKAASSSSTGVVHAPVSSSNSSTSAIVVSGNEDLLNSPLVQFALARLDSHPPSPRAVAASPSSTTAHSPSFARSHSSTPTKAETAHMVHAQSSNSPKTLSDFVSSKVYDPQAHNRSYSPSASPAESPRSFPSPDVERPATVEVDAHRYQTSANGKTLANGRTAKKLTSGARATQSTAQSVIYSGAQDAQTATAAHKRLDDHQASPSPISAEPQREPLTALQQLRKITPLPHEQPASVKAHVWSSTAAQQPAPSPPAATSQEQQQPASIAPKIATAVPQAAPSPVATAPQQQAVRAQTASSTAAETKQAASPPVEVSLRQAVSPTRELPTHLTVKTGAENLQQHANTQSQNAMAPGVSPVAAAARSPITSSPTSNTEGSAAKSIIYGSGDAPSPTSRRYTKAVPGQYASKESPSPNPSPSPVISSSVESKTMPPPSMRTAKVSPLPPPESKPSPAPDLKQESSFSKYGNQESPTFAARGTTDAKPAMKGILYGGNDTAKDQPKRHIRTVEGQYATKTTAIFGDPSLNSVSNVPVGDSPRASLRNSRNRAVAGKIGER